MYDTRNDGDLLSAVGGWKKRWMPWRRCGAIQRRYLSTYVDRDFIRCTADKSYGSSLALIVRNVPGLTDAAPNTHSLEYVAVPRYYDWLPVLTNFQDWWKKIQFEKRLRATRHGALFVS